MDIEELVQKHYAEWVADKDALWTECMTKALKDQAETHAIELRAYEATVQNQAERIRQLEAERVPDGWIQVSDRLPDSDVSFLAVTDCAGDIHISTMRLPVLIAKNEKQSGEFIRERVTHWMPLPAAPQPKKEGE